MRLTAVEKTEIERIKQFLDNNPHRRLHVKQIAEKTFISKAKISTGFYQLYNVSLYQYQLRVNMAFAMEAIKSGAQVKQMAYQLGYCDSASFTRAFKSVYKRVPQAFRELVVLTFYTTTMWL